MEKPKSEAVPELPPELVQTIPRVVPKTEMSKPQTTAPAAPEKKIEAPAPQTEEKPEAPAIDLSGVEVGTTVKHKKFGEGTIESFTKDHKLFRVKFQIGEKTFQFPQAFENGFLSI